MALNWKDIRDVADALNRNYEADIINLDDTAIIKMINDLEGWADAPEPPDDHVCRDIIDAWIELTDDYS